MALDKVNNADGDKNAAETQQHAAKGNYDSNLQTAETDYKDYADSYHQQAVETAQTEGVEANFNGKVATKVREIT